MPLLIRSICVWWTLCCLSEITINFDLWRMPDTMPCYHYYAILSIPCIALYRMLETTMNTNQYRISLEEGRICVPGKLEVRLGIRNMGEKDIVIVALWVKTIVDGNEYIFHRKEDTYLRPHEKKSIKLPYQSTVQVQKKLDVSEFLVELEIADSNRRMCFEDQVFLKDNKSVCGVLRRGTLNKL